jgi:hypothetical protein
LSNAFDKESVMLAMAQDDNLAGRYIVRFYDALGDPERQP